MGAAPHDMNIGWRVVRPDFTSSYNFRWPFPGQWAEASGPFTEGGNGCPAHIGDGLCIAINAAGAASGGIPLSTVLVVGYYDSDVLARAEFYGKIRVKRALVLDVWDAHAVIRAAGRANLSRADLSRADLSRADLSRADLSRADLSGASLSGADLSGADLSGARLSGAHLSGAHLSGASLYGANLSGADLSDARLSGAHLSGAYCDDLTLWPTGFDWRAAVGAA